MNRVGYDVVVENSRHFKFELFVRAPGFGMPRQRNQQLVWHDSNVP